MLTLFIVVDDGCTEGSGDVAIQTFRAHPSVHVLKWEPNGGVGAAMKTGIEKALILYSVDLILSNN